MYESNNKFDNFM